MSSAGLEISYGVKELALINPDPPGQNGHHFIGSPRRQWPAPVVGFSIVELVEQLDGVQDGRETAKQRMVDVLVVILGQSVVGRGNIGRPCALG